MCQEAGVELQFHTIMVDAIVEDGRVTGVVAASKSGLEAFRSQITVDCSADADVAARGGVEIKQGRDEDGLTQPMTLFFRVANVDDEVGEGLRCEAHPEDYRPFASIVAKAREAGEFPIPRKGIGLYKTLQPGVWRINTTRLLNATAQSVRDLTRAEIEGRRAGADPDDVLSEVVAWVRERILLRHGRHDGRPRDPPDRWGVHPDG